MSKKPTREERCSMTREELLRTVWLLDDVLEDKGWKALSELPNRNFEVLLSVRTKFGYEHMRIGGGNKLTIHAIYVNGVFKDEWFNPIKEFYEPYAWMYYPEPLLDERFLD